MKDIGRNTDETVEQLGSEVDCIGSSLRENIDKVVGGFSHCVWALYQKMEPSEKKATMNDGKLLL